MKEKINSLFSYLTSSLDTHSKGASARKLAAATIIICVVIAHINWLRHCYLSGDYSLLTTVLTIDYSFIGLCLGMTTYEKVKTNKPNEPQQS